MGRVGLSIGVMLLVISVVFVCQVGGVVYETLTRPELTSRSAGGAMQFDLRDLAIHDFAGTSQAFVLLNIWVVWAAFRLAKLGDQIPRGPLRVFAFSVATVLVGHAVALWLASQGTSVGLW